MGTPARQALGVVDGLGAEGVEVATSLAQRLTWPIFRTDAGS
jgi:hypothetical protein